MSINIKNREAETLLAELKRRTGKGTTDLLLHLLRREKERLESSFEAEVARAMEANRQLRDSLRARAVDGRPLVEEIEYDENGLPT